MPDHGTGRVQRFRDHVVAGVNWRPTRFVHEVPNSRVCGLCGVIPKWTVLLPCSHALCQSCHAASLQGSVGQCPLDQVQFEDAECVRYEFLTKTANTLKVHCWNKAHGCEYTGTMNHMLGHYENDCTFHSVECLRCGERVQHGMLPTHYVAGCTPSVRTAITGYPSSEPKALTREDVSAALEDRKPILAHPNHDQLLPVIQGRLKDLTEQVIIQEARFVEMTRELGAHKHNLKSEMARIAATVSSTTSHQLTCQQNAAEEASTSSSLSLRTEKALILRKLEHLAHQSHDVLERLRQTSPQPDSSRVIAHCKLLDGDMRHLTSTLSTTPARVKATGSMTYVLTLENCDEIIQWQQGRRKLAQITVWHMRDSYFTLSVWKHSNIFISDLTVEIEFYGMLVNSRCLPPLWRMSVGNMAEKKRDLLRCFCKHGEDSLAHFRLGFRIDIDSLKNGGFLREGKMVFRIDLDDEEVIRGVRGIPAIPNVRHA